MVGVSLDDGGWKVVKPLLAQAAAYTGVVDKADVKANIKAVLSQR